VVNNLTKGRITWKGGLFMGTMQYNTDQSQALQPTAAVPLSPLLIFLLLRKASQH